MAHSPKHLQGGAPGAMLGRQQDHGSPMRTAQEHLSRGALGIAMQTLQPLLEAKTPNATALQSCARELESVHWPAYGT